MANKYLDEIMSSLEPTPLFSSRFGILDTKFADGIVSLTDWELITKVLPDFKPIVMSDGLEEALEMFKWAYKEHLEVDLKKGSYTQMALHLLGQTFTEKLPN